MQRQSIAAPAAAERAIADDMPPPMAPADIIYISITTGNTSATPASAFTTLGCNILPLQRDGLISVRPGRIDRRSKELQLTKVGAVRFRAASEGWR